MTLKLFSAFSGYDSVLMALTRLSLDYSLLKVKLVGWCDIDPDAIVCHNVNFPEYCDLNYGDISRIKWEKVEDFDIFSMTYPCQDLSYSGKRMGGEEGSGTRSALLWECEKAIAIKKPKYVILENVKPLMDTNNEGTFLKWQQRISKYGYINYSQVLDAASFGVPQHRERTYMISIMADKESPNPLYEFPTGACESISMNNFLEKVVDEKYYLSQAKCVVLMKLLNSSKGETISINNNKICNVPDEGSKGKMVEQYVTPLCKGNVIPTLTAQGTHGSPRAMFSTGEHPCPGVIEIWTKNK